MPSLSPDALATARISWTADEAERDVLRMFRGVHPSTFAETWAERLSDLVAEAFLNAQVESLGVVADNLTTLAGSPVTPDPTPWLGKVGRSSLSEFLDVTPLGFMARIATGMTPLEAAVSSAGFLSSSAAAETHAVARGATCYTASEDPHFQGWARVAEPGACDFCRMLASRGAVYESKDSASKRADGLRYHTKRANGSGGLCRCTVKALPRGERVTVKTLAPAGPAVYKSGARTPERARFVAHQIDVLRRATANGGKAWDLAKLAELEAEQAAI